MMEKRKTTIRFQKRRTLRLTAEEEARITRQAATAGISVSEYMRRLFFGGRPVIARTDDQAIRELRRLGGLLTHNFALASEAHQSAVWGEMSRTLKIIQEAIDRLGTDMILKQCKRTNLTKTKRSMIGGIVDYVLSEKDGNGRNKCVWSTALNSIAATRKGQRAGMISLAEESVRSRIPVSHWMMSWNENEISTGQQSPENVRMFLRGMGLEEHQIIT